MAKRKLSSKADHIAAALDGKSEVSASRTRGLGFDELRFSPATLPEVDFEAIDTSLELLGKRISAPVMISPMTGGLKRGATLNRRMAAAAEALGLPFGVGSQRVALEVKGRAKDFQVRRFAPSIPLFANLGAIQLVKGYGEAEAQRAVEMIGADALYLHLNAMQEIVQEGGDTQWSGVLKAIGALCEAFERRGSVPIYAREVGFGIPADQARRLIDAGIQGIDCAGAGGTSWTLLEGRVARGAVHRSLGDTFASWGLTTPESILEVRRAHQALPLIASGGIRSGLDVAKAVALGATVAGMASPVLKAAIKSQGAVIKLLSRTVLELKVTMFGVGARNLQEFRRQPRILLPGQGPARDR